MTKYSFGTGPAVHGLRCQADRKIYQRLMMEELNATPNLQIMEGRYVEYLW